MDALKAAYRAVTRQIEVKVTPRFLPERSSPENGYFFWAYTIKLTNHGSETVQLKTRHWRITDAHGRLQEVRGAGVVGEEPVLKPGENFEYTSGVPLPTPSGLHGRQLRHGDRGWRAIRHRDPGLLPRHPAAGAHDQLRPRFPGTAGLHYYKEPAPTQDGAVIRSRPWARTRRSSCRTRR